MNTWWKRFAAILVAFLAVPGAIASADEQPIDEFVRSYVEEHMSESRVPGLVFVHVDAGDTATLAFGRADIETGRPMTTTTPLRVGSISKPITAAIALELAAAGELDLDRPVDQYLGVDLSDEYGPASTIRQLLQHRGGYGDAIVGSHHIDPNDAMDLDEWIARAPVRSIPNGVVASYTSVGYTVVGTAIEGAVGESFSDVARRILFDPLGMTGATFAQPAHDDVATGYSWEGGDFTAYPLDATDLSPGAGLTASGEDVAAFISALLSDDGPLAPVTRDGLLTPVGPAPGLRGFTTGLTEWRYDDRTVLYHEGNGIGTTNRMIILPDLGVGMYAAVNGEAINGMGDPSLHTQFIRDLHREIIDRFYPGSSPGRAVPHLDDRGTPTQAVPGVYIPTRVDTTSPLRLEALVSQSVVAETASGITFNGRPYVDDGTGTYRGASADVRFVEGPDGVTYATTGGTGSYREAAWWERSTPNLVLVGGSLIVMLLGLAIGVRPAGVRERRVMISTAALALAFVGLLGYGLATLEVMDLFTGLPLNVRLAQVAALGLGAMALIGTIRLLTRKDRSSARVLGSALAVSASALALTVWALTWRILPL